MSPAPAAPAPKGAKRSRSPALQLLTELEVPTQVAADWLAIRAAKRSPLTPTAVAALRREAQAAGVSVADAVQVAVERGWAGFKAAWVQREAAEVSTAGLSQAGRKTAAAIDRWLKSGGADGRAN